MDRRNFFKIVSTTSAGLVTGACSNKGDQLIPLLVPDREIVPGEEQWHPAVCGECAAGCGVIVRVMEGERIIDRDSARGSEKLRERIACIKKIEGNPLDPVSGGRLCARGNAVVQALYNPDRLRGPMRRTGARGKAEFAPVSWDEAIASAADKLVKVRSSDPGRILFLTGANPGTRAVAIQRFLAALGAAPAVACSLADFRLERKAAQQVFGWSGLPVYDLSRARYALGIGADFLGGWASPVFYGRQFGNFRQGRAGVRGTLVQAESRMSITASSADRWLPIRPGSEPQFAVAVARVLLDEKLARNRESVPKAVLSAIESTDLTALIKTCGLDDKRLRRVARELGESEAPLVIAGASVVQSNSLEALVAASYLNMLLGNVGRAGGVLPPAPSRLAAPEQRSVTEALARAQFLVLDGVNPAYTLPASSGVAEMLGRVETIVSFNSFLDDTGVYADLLLPDHHILESAAAVVPAVAAGPSITVATPFVKPLYDTRAAEQTLAEIARKAALPFEAPTPQSLVQEMLPAERTWDEVAREGGLWLEAERAQATAPKQGALEISSASFAGDPAQFPLHFQPYLSLQYHDGAGANLPWMRELPDPVSSAMWGLPVEIDPQTAAGLQIRNGDLVRVESPHGKIEAPAYVHPAALPGVVSMPIGEGHSHYGRYASNRGANPLSILATAFEKSTGAQVLGSTRVRLTRIGSAGGLIQFSTTDREHGADHGHR